MSMPFRQITAFISLSILGASPLPAQIITVKPPETAVAFKNPLMGFRGSTDGKHPYASVVHHYIRWRDIENDESDTVQKIRDYCNKEWAGFPEKNIKVIPRVYLDYGGGPGDEYWPADIETFDWKSQKFKDRVVRLIGRLGEVWDNDPRVAWVQTGIIGHWGEQESPVGISQDGWSKRLGDAFTAAFKNKMMSVRNMDAWPGYEMGTYWDSFAHPYQAGVSDTIQKFNNQGRYLNTLIEGEVGYNWGNDGADKLYGAGPTETMAKDSHTDYMIDAIRKLHCTSLGWISGYSTNGDKGSDPKTVKANAARTQREFGYRFHIPEFSCANRTEPGSNLNLQFKVKNNGSAPFYENWPLAVVLIDESTREIVWKATLPNVDIRTWHPGHSYNSKTKAYQTPAREHQIRASIPLPGTLKNGQYLVGLSILEPLSRSPGIFFSVPSFFKQSQSQPLCRIGIGMNAASHNLTGVSFDDLLTDDKRFYTMKPQWAAHTLNTQTSPQGVISPIPGGSSQIEGTGVQVMANGNLGYAFSSWAGDLAGSTRNPAVIVMDKAKNISANYVAVPTYKLSANAVNGSVTLNPPGGVYNAGTVVKITAVPAKEYAFSSWSGNLAGATNSQTITMSTHMKVTAAFVSNPNGGAFDFRVNCGGGAHTGWDGCVYEADTNSAGGTYSTGAAIGNSPDEALYQNERWGKSFGYEFPLANGDYEVTLMFAENYFKSAGERVFNVSIEGNHVIKNLDICSKVGKHVALNKTDTVAVKDGRLNIDFDTVTGNATIAAIRVRKMPVSDCVLKTDAPNALISLNPPGGIYPRGAVVTMTAKPNRGYQFASWAGDVNGTENPITVTMNGNKSVSATACPLD